MEERLRRGESHIRDVRYDVSSDFSSCTEWGGWEVGGNVGAVGGGGSFRDVLGRLVANKCCMQPCLFWETTHAHHATTAHKHAINWVFRMNRSHNTQPPSPPTIRCPQAPLSAKRDLGSGADGHTLQRTPCTTINNAVVQTELPAICNQKQVP